MTHRPGQGSSRPGGPRGAPLAPPVLRTSVRRASAAAAGPAGVPSSISTNGPRQTARTEIRGRFLFSSLMGIILSASTKQERVNCGRQVSGCNDDEDEQRVGQEGW